MTMRERLQALEATMVEALRAWEEDDEATLDQFWDIVRPWAEESSGETQSGSWWFDQTKDVFVWGGDFLRDERELGHHVWAKLERLGLDVTSSDQCSFCGGCCHVVGTDYDDSFLVTDGDIYCPHCAKDMLADAVIERWDPQKPITTLGGLLGGLSQDYNIRSILYRWSVCLHHRHVLDSFQGDDWKILETAQYYPPVTGVTAEEAVRLANEALAEGRIVFTVQGYSYLTYLVIGQFRLQEEG